jgi:hypothetical protein
MDDSLPAGVLIALTPPAHVDPDVRRGAVVVGGVATLGLVPVLRAGQA